MPALPSATRTPTAIVRQTHKEDLERLKRDLRFAEERAEDASKTKSSEVSGLLAKYNRQINELEESLRVSSHPFLDYSS